MSEKRERRKQKPMLNASEVSEMLGISRATLVRAIANGKVPFPAYKVGKNYLIPRAAIEKMLAGEAIEAGSSTGLAQEPEPDDET